MPTTTRTRKSAQTPDKQDSHGFTVERCREILGAEGSSLSDTQIECLRDQLTALAGIAVDAFANHRGHAKNKPQRLGKSRKTGARILKLDNPIAHLPESRGETVKNHRREQQQSERNKKRNSHASRNL